MSKKLHKFPFIGPAEFKNIQITGHKQGQILKRSCYAKKENSAYFVSKSKNNAYFGEGIINSKGVKLRWVK